MDEYLVNPTFYSIPSKNDIVYFLTQWDNTTNWINSDINYDELDFTLKNRNNWVGATTNYVVGNYVVDSISKTVYKCILDINQSPSNFRPALDATHWTVSSDETIIIAPVVGSLVYQNTSGADLEIPYNFFA
jgi:ABC-type proline/glycine betaine transport system substrate-binding protein